MNYRRHDSPELKETRRRILEEASKNPDFEKRCSKLRSTVPESAKRLIGGGLTYRGSQEDLDNATMDLEKELGIFSH